MATLYKAMGWKGRPHAAVEVHCVGGLAAAKGFPGVRRRAADELMAGSRSTRQQLLLGQRERGRFAADHHAVAALEHRLVAQGVRVVSLRRSNGRVVDPASDPPLKDGDTLVLSGRPDTLALAEELLLKS